MPSCASRSSRRNKSECRVKKCARSGKVTKNAFFNFLRCYRQKQENCGKRMSDIAVRGAKVWNCLPECQRAKYVLQVSGANPEPIFIYSDRTSPIVMLYVLIVKKNSKIIFYDPLNQFCRFRYIILFIFKLFFSF